MAPTRLSWFLYGVLCVALLGLAAWLRVENSLVRQFHADEGVQSYQAWRLIEEGGYRYDPAEHHGPSLYYLTKWAYQITSDDGELTDFRMRLVPMAFGLGIIAFGAWAFRRFGRLSALAWAALAAIAPLAVIYGAYYVQESLLAFFSLAAAYAIFRYFEKPSVGWAAGVGFGWGFMHVTKETAALHIFAMLVAVLASCLMDRATRASFGPRWWKDLGVAVGIVAALHVLFFSSFFSNASGVTDAVVAYFNYADRAQGQGHEKGPLYYLSLLMPQTKEGIKWGEAALLCAFAVGLAVVAYDRLKSCSRANRFAAFFACFGMAMFLLYSIIPYKTPWLLLTPYLVFCYVAAYGLARLLQRPLEARRYSRYVSRGVASALAVWMFAELGHRSRLAVFKFPSASRNPYLYQHTTPRYDRLLARIDRIVEGAERENVSIGVYSPDGAWPLPWHLRNARNVGYWSSLSEFTPHSMDIIDTRLLERGLPEGAEDGLWELFGLRPNTLLSLRISEDLKHIILQP